MEARNILKSVLLTSATTLSLFAAPMTQVQADGSQTLGTPSVTIATGTDIVAAGTGMISQPGVINFNVPAGATVEQVLLYWEGFSNSPSLPDDAIEADGVNVVGANIGSVVTPIGNRFDAFRADVTGLVTVNPGANSISLSGMSFDGVNNGAGIMVIFDDGSSESFIDIRDGLDRAFINSVVADGQVTVPQVFNFVAEGSDRTGELNLFFSSVSGSASGGAPLRPSAIDVTSGGVTTTYDNLLDSNDGDEWDTVTLSVNIPAGADSVTVQAHSVDNPPADVGTPASFNWITAGLSVPVTPPGGGEGCTPGYWRQPHHFDSWVGYAPTDLFSSVFEDAFPGLTLLDVVLINGGGLNALGRHSVAALLNAASGDVASGLTPADVIDSFNAVFPGTKLDYETLKDELDTLNNQGCPLN